MPDKAKPTEIPGVISDMIPAVVMAARMAREQTPFDEWIHDVLHGESGVPIRHDFPAPDASPARQNKLHF